MKIISWNVNSIRVRNEQVQHLVDQYKPSVLAVQEIKATSSAYPKINVCPGSCCVVNGQPAYNGVAVHTRAAHYDAQLDPFDTSLGNRVIALTYKGIRFINVYVPNGGKDPDAYVAKLQWLASLMEYMYEQQRSFENIIVTGDFNICPTDADVYDPVAWKDSICCTEAERAFHWAMTHSGFHDAWTEANPGEEGYSWWDYRNSAFSKNRGLRIDLFIVSDNIRKHITECQVLKEYRAEERPSDHAPILLTIEK